MSQKTAKFERYAIFLLLIVFHCTAFAQKKNPMDIYPQRLRNYYERIDSLCRPGIGSRPVIAISVSKSMNESVSHAVELAGGLPYIISETPDQETIKQILSMSDGLIMTGGADIDPSYYGAEKSPQCGQISSTRDTYELLLLKKALDRSMPVLGICRGLQIINVAMGGTLIQDIPSETPMGLRHTTQKGEPDVEHDIAIAGSSEISRILGEGPCRVNSFHHQCIKKVAPELRITAWSVPDSIPEAVEAYPIRPIMAVQFHPETKAAKGDKACLGFFEHIVRQAALYRKAKEIHRRILTVDTHSDTPMKFAKGGSVGRRWDMQLVSIEKMEEGFLDAEFLAAYQPQKEIDDESMRAAVKRCQDIISSIYEDVAKYPDYCGIAVTWEDALRLKAEGKKAFFIGIENGYGIGNDLGNIRKYYDKGVNYMTLCHSYDNAICNSSSHTKDENKGLTAFGKKVVKEMNRVGMTIDLSHASMGTFWDVMKYSKLPVVCTHSGAKAVFFHDRNLTDEQLRALAKKDGVIQVSIYSGFLRKDKSMANIDDVIEHIDHCVKVAGIDHVGIGSDFDGGGGVLGCRGANDMIRITVKLLEKGYTEQDLKKIWGENFFRVISKCRKAGK